MGLFEFEASLVSRVSSRTARAVIQINPFLKKKKKKERKKKKRKRRRKRREKKRKNKRKKKSINK